MKFFSSGNISKPIIQIVFFMAIIFFVYYFFLNSKFKPVSAKGDCEREKGIAFKGIIAEIRLDSENRAQKFIFLKDGNKILPSFTCCLWNIVEVGDSIIKYPDTI